MQERCEPDRARWIAVRRILALGSLQGPATSPPLWYKRSLKSNSGQIVLWDMNMPSFWSAVFLNKVAILCSNALPCRACWVLFTGPGIKPAHHAVAAAAAQSLQSCPTLCGPIDGSPPGSPIPRILQASTLEWVAISFSNA